MHQTPTQPVPVGTPVWFLQYGDANDSPMAGTILQISDQMVARISYINADGVIGHKNTVYPVGHKSLKDDKGLPTMNARRNGAWTYHPYFTPPTPVVAEAKPKKTTTKSS